MEQPEGFEQGEPGQVLCLKRSLYEFKQASRMWYQKLQTVLINIGFHCVEVDSSIYVFTRETVHIIMPVFVDDITLASNSLAAIQSVVKELQSHFRLRDLGPTHVGRTGAVWHERLQACAHSHGARTSTFIFHVSKFTSGASGHEGHPLCVCSRCPALFSHCNTPRHLLHHLYTLSLQF